MENRRVEIYHNELVVGFTALLYPHSFQTLLAIKEWQHKEREKGGM